MKRVKNNMDEVKYRHAKPRHLSPSFIKWRNQIIWQLDALNEGFELGLNKHYYHLSHRGKNHRICLMDEDEVIAYGMTQITRVVCMLRCINNLYEGANK